MSKVTKTNLTWTLFREITEKLKTEEFYLQIEDQDCYLIQSSTGQLVKVKVGDLSHTKKHWDDQWMKKFERITKKAIKLSGYPNREYVYLEGKDKTKSTSTPLPIEIQSRESPKEVKHA